MLIHSVVSNSLQPHGLYPAKLLCPEILQARPESEPISPALAGRFFTTETPEKPCLFSFFNWNTVDLQCSVSFRGTAK